MTPLHTSGCVLVAGALLASPAPLRAQSTPRATGRIGVHVNAASRTGDDGSRRRETEVSTAVALESADTGGSGAEFGLDLRHSASPSGTRPQRLSIYNGFAGARFGEDLQVRLRGGHMWLPDLGTLGSLAGGLVEVGQRRAPGAEGGRIRAGVFTGLEPDVYDLGYAADVRKTGGYAAYESGYLRRHVVGYTRVSQGTLTERSVLSVTNFVPAGSRVFAYQAAEVEVGRPAGGAGGRGLSYFLTNLRVTPAARLELQGTYNRGRSLDARRLTSDLLGGRALTPQALEGIVYESGGGRVTAEVLPRLRVYAGYARDRTNREDSSTGRTTFGGHAGNVFGSGFDVSASNARVHRATGPYHSTFVSIGHPIGRAGYVSVDYATSLSVIRFERSDGVVIETHPSTRRVSGSGSVVLTRALSLLVTTDYMLDDMSRELRLLSGLSYRLR